MPKSKPKDPGSKKGEKSSAIGAEVTMAKPEDTTPDESNMETRKPDDVGGTTTKHSGSNQIGKSSMISAEVVATKSEDTIPDDKKVADESGMKTSPRQQDLEGATTKHSGTNKIRNSSANSTGAAATKIEETTPDRKNVVVEPSVPDSSSTLRVVDNVEKSEQREVDSLPAQTAKVKATSTPSAVEGRQEILNTDHGHAHSHTHGHSHGSSGAAESHVGSDKTSPKKDSVEEKVEGEGEEHMDRELTFAEFSAREKRLASSKEANMVKTGAQASKPKLTKSTTAKPGYRTSVLGAFVQSYRVQVPLLFLLLLDGLAGFMETLVDPKEMGQLTLLGFEVDISDYLARWLQISLTFFVAELVLQFVAFDKQFLFHPGCFLDLLVVGLHCYAIANDAHYPGYRLLSWLRLWRLLQIPQQILADLKQQCAEFQQQQRDTLNQLNKVQARATSLENILDKERETTKYSEQMLRQYKEEVETLREALQLAARSWTNQFGVDFPAVAPRFKVEKSGKWEKSYVPDGEEYDATPESQYGYDY